MTINFNFVTPRLATGGDLPEDKGAALAAVAEWRRLGITHVVDNRVEYSDEAFVKEHAPEIRYLHNGVDDDGNAPADEWFDRGVAFISAALEAPEARVLTHCHMGINRGPSLAYAALLDAGFEASHAIDLIRAARPIAGVSYAEDALDWFHRRNDIAPDEREAAHVRLAHWRTGNPIDLVRIIRKIRQDEAANRVA